MSDQGGIERLIVDVTHRQRRRGRAVDLDGSLVEVTERLARNVSISGGFELPAAPGLPVVPGYRPGPPAMHGLEVDLDDLPGSVAPHHHMKE
jgi:hypothetical protein